MALGFTPVPKHIGQMYGPPQSALHPLPLQSVSWHGNCRLLLSHTLVPVINPFELHVKVGILGLRLNNERRDIIISNYKYERYQAIH